MQAQVLNAHEYGLPPQDLLVAPRLLVYRTRLEQNVSLMRRYLESVVPGSGFQHLMPHVKTHKSAWVTRSLMGSGVRRFKCTLHELEMLSEVKAQEVFLAYPLAAQGAERLAACATTHPGTRFIAQMGCWEHAEHLAEAARKHGIALDCLLDLNVGQDRTGTSGEKAVEIARRVTVSPAAQALKIVGIHAYAGHNRSTDKDERAACSREAMGKVVRCLMGLRKAGLKVHRIVAGGTPAFLDDLRELVVEQRVDAQVDVSPGTWVYWDTSCEEMLPGMFEFAALLLGEVIDLPAPQLVTINLGSKRWGVDSGPLRLFSVPGLEVASVTEEHTVLRNLGQEKLRVTDRILMAPQHACTTVNLWETFAVVGDDGKLQDDSVPVDGRNR